MNITDEIFGIIESLTRVENLEDLKEAQTELEGLIEEIEGRDLQDFVI